MGVCETQDKLSFRYSDACADSVFVVGSFNGWGESLPMTRLEGTCVWEASVDKCSVSTGDEYKYKIYADGREEYKSDPYARGVGYAPYFNSVIVDDDHYEWSDGEWLENLTGDRDVDSPINVYAIDAARWKTDENGEALSCEKLCEELIPYVKQMGYTHVCLCNVLDDRAPNMPRAYFAIKHGEEYRIKALIDGLHREGIGAMLKLDAEVSNGDDVHIMADSVGYWADSYHIDGFVIMTDADEAVSLIGERYSGLLVIDGGSVLKYEVNGMDGICDEWCRFAAMRAMMTYKMIMPCAHITQMGEEIGREALTDRDDTVEWRLLEREANARLQLFCSKLNYAYLGCRRLWSNTDGGKTEVKEDGYPSGVFTVRRTSRTGEILAVVNLTANVYEDFSVDATYGEYREMFNSDAHLYGGSGVTNGEEIIKPIAHEKGKIRIKVPPLAVTVLESVKI